MPPTLTPAQTWILHKYQYVHSWSHTLISRKIVLLGTECLCHPKLILYVETLPTNVMVLGDGRFWRNFGFYEVMKVEPSWIQLVSLNGGSRKLLPSLSQTKVQRGNSYLESRKRALTRHQICRHLDLDLPVSRPMRNKFLVFISSPVHSILQEQPKHAKTHFHLGVSIWIAGIGSVSQNDQKEGGWGKTGTV